MVTLSFECAVIVGSKEQDHFLYNRRSRGARTLRLFTAPLSFSFYVGRKLSRSREKRRDGRAKIASSVGSREGTIDGSTSDLRAW